MFCQPARHRRAAQTVLPKQHGLTREFDTTYQTHYWYSEAGRVELDEPPGWASRASRPRTETDRLTNKDDELELVDLGRGSASGDAGRLGR